MQEKIGKEQAFAFEKKVFHLKDGSTIRISSEKIPPNI